MTDRSPRVSDVGLERALARRAPRGPDAALLTEIVAVAGQTRQRPAWWRWTGSGRIGRRMTLGWIALLLVAALAAGVVLVGGFGRDRSDLSIVPPVPTGSPGASAPSSASPAPTAPPSPDPAIAPGPVTCPGDNVQVLTGSDVRPAEPIGQLPALGAHRAMLVGLGAVDVGPAGAGLTFPTLTLWSVRDGHSNPEQVATIYAPGNVVDIADAPTDGSFVLLRIGHFSPSGASPECTDLYEVPTDGSRASRLTRLGPGESVSAAAVSPDGTRVAYVRSQLAPSEARLAILDESTGTPAEWPTCQESSTDAAAISWSPGGDLVAVNCRDRLAIVDPRPGSDIVSADVGGWILALKWQDGGGSLLVADATDLSGAGGLAFLTVDSRTGRSRPTGTVHDRQITWVEGEAFPAFSPDGRLLLAGGGKLGVKTGQDFVEVAYVVDRATGKVTQVLDERQAFPAWWADDSTLIIVDGATSELARRNGDGTISDRAPMPPLWRALWVGP